MGKTDVRWLDGELMSSLGVRREWNSVIKFQNIRVKLI